MSDVTLKAVLLGEDRSMGRTFRGAGDDAERTGKRIGGLGGSFAALAGPVGIGLAAVGAAGAGFEKLTQFLGDSVAEARESAKVGKTTAQIIKSTGGAAKISADDVGNLANQLSVKAGVDDEVIQTGANLLLTFKNIRNEVGEGNKIFDRATAAAVDLSAAGFGSVDNASKMLGKALNDPLKGITALGRAGVTFSDQQKEQIKTLVKHGDTLGAQKLILKEVESQVGGVASASADMGEKVSVAWGNFKENVGTKLLPVLDKLGGWFIDKGLPALEKFGGWISDKLWPALKQGYETIMPGVHQALSILTGGVDGGTVSWKKIGEVITTKVIPFLSLLARAYLPVLATQWRVIIEVVKAVIRYVTFWRDIVARVASFILEKFASIASTGASMLRALSKVPGFGWAKDAADKLDRAASKARTLSRNIAAIPSNKNVTINVSAKATTGRIRVGNESVNIGMRAGGGRIVKGATYLTGENGPELVTAQHDGFVNPHRQTAALLRGGGDGAGGGATTELLQPIQFKLGDHVVLEALLRIKSGRGGVSLGLG